VDEVNGLKRQGANWYAEFTDFWVNEGTQSFEEETKLNIKGGWINPDAILGTMGSTD